MRAASAIVERTPNRIFRPVLASFIRLGHDNGEIASDSADVHWQPYGRHGGAAAFVRRIRSLRTADTLGIAHRLPQLDVPTRVVWGASDRFQKWHYGDDWRATSGATSHVSTVHGTSFPKITPNPSRERSTISLSLRSKVGGDSTTFHHRRPLPAETRRALVSNRAAGTVPA